MLTVFIEHRVWFVDGLMWNGDPNFLILEHLYVSLW
jgi:hypothetical protein